MQPEIIHGEYTVNDYFPSESFIHLSHDRCNELIDNE